MKAPMKFTAMMGAVFSLALISSQAHAFNEGACKEDMQKFCAGIQPGDGRLKDCMKQHESELSPACKENKTEMKEHLKEKREELKQACSADIQQFCANVTPGEGREIACLRSYSDKLSPACKEKMPMKGKGMHKGMHPAHDAPPTTPAPPASK